MAMCLKGWKRGLVVLAFFLFWHTCLEKQPWTTSSKSQNKCQLLMDSVTPPSLLLTPQQACHLLAVKYPSMTFIKIYLKSTIPEIKCISDSFMFMFYTLAIRIIFGGPCEEETWSGTPILTLQMSKILTLCFFRSPLLIRLHLFLWMSLCLSLHHAAFSSSCVH